MSRPDCVCPLTILPRFWLAKKVSPRRCPGGSLTNWEGLSHHSPHTPLLYFSDWRLARWWPEGSCDSTLGLSALWSVLVTQLVLPTSHSIPTGAEHRKMPGLPAWFLSVNIQTITRNACSPEYPGTTALGLWLLILVFPDCHRCQWVSLYWRGNVSQLDQCWLPCAAGDESFLTSWLLSDIDTRQAEPRATGQVGDRKTSETALNYGILWTIMTS